MVLASFVLTFFPLLLLYIVKSSAGQRHSTTMIKRVIPVYRAWSGIQSNQVIISWTIYRTLARLSMLLMNTWCRVSSNKKKQKKCSHDDNYIYNDERINKSEWDCFVSFYCQATSLPVQGNTDEVYFFNFYFVLTHCLRLAPPCLGRKWLLAV